MNVSLVAALGSNRVIGKDNLLPWSLPADLKYFKELTSGKVVIQGRKSFESIITQLGRPLPNRTNIILSSRIDFEPSFPDCYVYNSIEDLIYELESYSDEEEVFVIGGSETYKHFLPHANRIYLTKIDHTFEGDSYFPEVDISQWKLESSTKGVKDEANPYDYYFNVYTKL